MATAANPGPIIRFGAFSVDLRAAELRKNGIRLPLQGRPIQILVILLEQPGQVVTREELRRHLWPADTFVDFDHALHNGIARLREALGDSAEAPRYIETLPRRGYRYVGPAMESASIRPVPVDVSTASTPAKTRTKKRPLLIAGLILAAIGVLGVGGWQYRYLSPAVPAIHSLAVLPLDNLSGDPAQEYFSDGMTDELITDLAQISSLKVISRTSVMQYKKARGPLPRIARELGVDAIVEGSVTRTANRVRITAQLIDARNDRHLWAQGYERDIGDAVTLQNQVAIAIANEIRAQLTPAQRMQLARPRPVNPAAYEAYLKGRHYWSSRKQLQPAIENFQQAVALAPNYALAYAGLSEAYASAGYWGLMPPRQANPLALEAARKAAQLDDSLAEVHAAFAAFACQNDLAMAERELRRAVELNPSDSNSHRHYATLYMAKHEFQKANEETEVARQLDPLSAFASNTKGYMYYLERDYDAAIAQFRKALELDPNYPLAYLDLGLLYTQKKMFKEAEAASLKARELTQASSPMAISGLGYMYGSFGRTEKAREQLQALLDLKRQQYVSPLNSARVYIGLGDKTHALAAIEDAAAEDTRLMCDATFDPVYDGIRQEPRFTAAIQKVCPWVK
jgi:TolB-like protein/DNA-binding winged helix-turn-helix (wHTH) protein/Flp pilus assembly protein TadD